MVYEDEFVPALSFWPEHEVCNAFNEAAQAIGTDEETTALRVFYARMKHHLKTADSVGGAPDYENRMIEHYERPRLEAEVAWITGKVPVPCEGCTLRSITGGADNKEDSHV